MDFPIHIYTLSMGLPIVYFKGHQAADREHSGSVVECLTLDRGAVGSTSPASLCCVLEQDTFILA